MPGILTRSLLIMAMVASSASITLSSTAATPDRAGQTAAPATAPTSSPISEPAVVRAAGSFQALSPQRILDTRTGLGAVGPVGPIGSISVPVLNVGGVPASGVASVLITVTATHPTAPGYITVYPDGGTRPVASNLDFWAGRTVANSVVVPVGANGRIRLFNGSAGSVQLLGDVAGFYAAGTATSPGTFASMPPSRLLDTRTALGAASDSPLAAQAMVNLTVEGRNGIPKTGVSAVLINVTVARPTRAGYVTVYSPGFARPTVSSLDFGPSQTVANLVVAPVAGDGQIRFFNGSPGSVHLVADVAGYYLAGIPTAAGSLKLVTPTRLLDTRSGVGAPAKPLSGNGSVALTIRGNGGIPKAGVSAVAMNVTATQPTAAGYLTVYPDGAGRPTTSNLDFLAGQNPADLVMVPIGADGKVRLLNGGGGSVDVLADVVGYFLDGSGPAACNAIGPDSTGDNVTRWAPLVLCILASLGQSSGNLSDVETIIYWESSGDPNAINLTDSNAKAGHPSEGLIQVIRPTFDTYRTLLLPNDLYNPAANLYAGLHYAINTYGSIHNVPGLVSLRNGGPYIGYVLHKHP